jgi:hypothetical protein
LNQAGLISRVIEKCSSELMGFVEKADANLCRTQEEFNEAFSRFSVRTVEGVAWQSDRELDVAVLKLAEAVTETVGSNRLGIETVRESAFKAYANCVANDQGWDDINLSDRVAAFREELINLSLVSFDVVGPCEIFGFEGGARCLISDHVSVLPANEFLNRSKIQKQGKNWSLVAIDSEWPDKMSVGRRFEIGGNVWWIKSESPKDLASQNAQWMADIFVSALRLGLRPADYCHRPRIGKVEADPFSRYLTHDRPIRFNEEVSYFGGGRSISQYKVDTDFEARFHSTEFQARLNLVLAPKSNSLGARLGNALGWCTRGRQAKDNSERLLYFFTAIESLLSEKSGFVPVSDSIARYISVIIAKKIEDRERTYREVKKLYGLRSELVHRGHRNAHWLNANNIQNICETTLHFVWKELDFDCRHEDFIKHLKSATHGTPWPSGSKSNPPAP